MTDEHIANICIVLSTMKADQKWTAAHEETYLLGLDDLPDEAGRILRREIQKQFDWRPSVKEIRDLWAKISSPVERSAPDMLVARFFALRDKYGEYVCPHPELPGIMEPGEPRWTDPQLRRLAAARGGWVAFCREQGNETQAAQLLNLAKLIIGGESDAAVQTLRLEYQASRPAIESPAIVLEPPRFPLAQDEQEGGPALSGLVPLGALALRGLK